jgi:hypothetical protein
MAEHFPEEVLPMALYWPSIARKGAAYPQNGPAHLHKRTSCSAMQLCRLQVFAYFLEELLPMALNRPLFVSTHYWHGLHLYMKILRNKPGPYAAINSATAVVSLPPLKAEPANPSLA